MHCISLLSCTKIETESSFTTVAGCASCFLVGIWQPLSKLPPKGLSHLCLSWHPTCTRKSIKLILCWFFHALEMAHTVHWAIPGSLFALVGGGSVSRTILPSQVQMRRMHPGVNSWVTLETPKEYATPDQPNVDTIEGSLLHTRGSPWTIGGDVSVKCYTGSASQIW